MSPHIIIHEPRPLARQAQRPSWPAVATTARRDDRLVIRPFATPVVRELPARREAVITGTW
jgi:hypothetical protein